MTLAMNAGASSVTPLAGYATSASPALPTDKLYASGAWGSAVTTSTLTSTVCWQIARNSPVGTSTPTRALVALTQDAALNTAVFSSGAWGAAQTMTSGTGTVNTRV